MTTLADSPEIAAEKAALRTFIRDAERVALEKFVERYGWYERGQQYVGHPSDPVPAEMAIDLTLRALWKGGARPADQTGTGN